MTSSSNPPLTGIRVVELAGLAPAPFASLLLADLGASVLRIDPPTTHSPPAPDLLTRHKSSLPLNLKHPPSLSLLHHLLRRADVLFDPFRPGVLEHLGLDPEKLLEANPRLCVARLTGFRRDGEYARMAGHDINYLAVAGVLGMLGREEGKPYAPGNLLADFAGGGLMCVVGILAALLSRAHTGKGQIVESNMVDGTSYLATFMRYARKTPLWSAPRGHNLLDGGCPFYDVYECRDRGAYMAVGALEPQFFRALLDGLGLEESWMEKRQDRGNWDELRRVLERRFREKTRREWEGVFMGVDACVTPVLGMEELEAGGFEQRAPVDLRGTPVKGVEGRERWRGKVLEAGKGAEAVLEEWMGWRKGKDYGIEDGGWVRLDGAKL